jgi:hypothetical protein
VATPWQATLQIEENLMKYLVKQGAIPFALVVDAGSQSEALLRAAIISITYFGNRAAPALVTVRVYDGESKNTAYFETGHIEPIESWLRPLFEECNTRDVNLRINQDDSQKDK